jgi:predicted nuclease of predicted toxin-antitoxin system
VLRFVADEDFTRAIVRGVLRARPDIDIVRVQDVGLRTQDDAIVLSWAATEGRVLLTHDVQTMPAQAYERVRNLLPMSGVFVVPQDEAIGRMIEE